MTDNKELYIKDITIEGIDKKDITSLTNGTEFKFENNFTILTGLNGSGKTNLLNYLCKISGDKVMRYIDVNYKLDSNLLKNPNKSIDSNEERDALQALSSRQQGYGNLITLNTVIQFNGQINNQIDKLFLNKIFEITFEEENYKKYCMEWTAKLEKIRNNDFIQELSNKILPIDSKLDDVLDKIDRFLQNTKKKFYIDRYGINNTLRLLKYDEFGKEKHIYFNDLSTGEKVIFTLAILQVSQSFKFDTELQVLLIDEFDAYLNPELSELLIETLKTQFIDKGVQVIFATHSPSTVAHAIKYGAKIQWMEDSKFVNKDNDKIISLLSNGLILLQDSSDTINLLYQGLNEKNHIIFVEGKTDKIHIESAIEKLGYKEKFNDIFIIHDNGEQLDSYIDLTMQIIFKKENKKFIAILDYDNAGYAMKEKINKKNPTVDVFLLPIIDDFKDYVDKFKEKKFYQPIEFYFDKSILDKHTLITENHDYFNILKGTIDEKQTIISPKLLKYTIKADDNKNETGDKVKFAEYMQTNGTAEEYKNFKPLLDKIYSLLY